jgi:hypothetical protein
VTDQSQTQPPISCSPPSGRFLYSWVAFFFSFYHLMGSVWFLRKKKKQGNLLNFLMFYSSSGTNLVEVCFFVFILSRN